MYYKINTKKLKPVLVASYDIRPGNGEGLFLSQRFINLSLIYLDTYPLTTPRPTWDSQESFQRELEHMLHTGGISCCPTGSIESLMGVQSTDTIISQPPDCIFA